jgi:hypothetical protein
MNAIAIIAAVIGALAGFGLVYASLKKANKGLAIALSVLGAGVGAVVGVFLAIVILVILMLVAIGFVVRYTL